MSAESRWNKIIAKKLAKILNDPNFEIVPESDSDQKDNSKYLIMFKPGDKSHYKGQLHLLSIDLKCGKPDGGPDDWFPANAPKTTFITKMFHTNVSPASGWICLDVLKDKWSPMNNIDTLVQSIILLLDDPAPTGNHLNAEAAQLQQACQKEFNKQSKALKKLHGKEYDAIYAECFAPYDEVCQSKYEENKRIVAKYIHRFTKYTN
jgi:ubiquitin-protein ligase